MLPNPLHPAVVHFPIVLAVLMPLFVIGALWAIRRGAAPLRAWSLPLAPAGLLVGAAGGALVYEHNAGQAYVDQATSVANDSHD